MANRKTKNSSRISIEVPNSIGLTRKQFIDAVSMLAKKEARALWGKENPGYTKPKGGKPSEYPDVQKACDYLWEKHSGPWTKGKFVERVAELFLSRGREKMDPKTIGKHVDTWIGELPILDVDSRFDDQSRLKKQLNAFHKSREEARLFGVGAPGFFYVLETVFWPWMQKHGYKTAGEARELEANSPPELLKEMERAKKEFVYIFESAITPWMEKNGHKASEYLGLKKKGLPPALSKNIELAKKRFRSLK